MKVLLSAYACEPNRGSEPGGGWHWALEIARMGHEVWVLTRANNREVIEPELRRWGRGLVSHQAPLAEQVIPRYLRVLGLGGEAGGARQGA